MAEIVRKIGPGQTVTFLVADNATHTYRDDLVRHGTAWVVASRLVLTRSINYTLKAMITPDMVASLFWEHLDMCFALPHAQGKSGAHKNQLNEILAVLNKTAIGLGGDLRIADMSQMPLMAKAQLKCMHPLSNTKDLLAGLVYVNAVEMSTRYIEGLLSRVPDRVKKTEWSGNINLSFENLMKMSGRHAVVTTIHEATHKFAATTDEQYFKDEKTPGMALAEWVEIGQRQVAKQVAKYESFDELLVEARSNAARIGMNGEALRNIRAMTRDRALRNADSYANFAIDVCDLPTEEETEEVIKLAMGRGKK